MSKQKFEVNDIVCIRGSEDMVVDAVIEETGFLLLRPIPQLGSIDKESSGREPPNPIDPESLVLVSRRT